GLPVAPVNSPADLTSDPHLVASGALAATGLPTGASVDVPLLPLTFDGARLGLRSDVPEPGRDNAHYLDGPAVPETPPSAAPQRPRCVHAHGRPRSVPCSRAWPSWPPPAATRHSPRARAGTTRRGRSRSPLRPNPDPAGTPRPALSSRRCRRKTSSPLRCPCRTSPAAPDAPG